MSLLSCVTSANPSLSLLGGGGGGGGGSNVPVQYVSTLFVSTINAPSNTVPVNINYASISTLSGIPNIPNGLLFGTGGAAEFSSEGEIIFTDSKGIMTGVSTINGARADASAYVSKINIGGAGGNFYVPPGGASVPLCSFSTLGFHAYQLEVPYLQVQNVPDVAPQAGAWADMSIDTAVKVTYLDTFDMASVSTIANDLQKAPVYTFVASGANHTMSATGNLANTLSTAITLGGPLYLKDLGLVTSYPNAN